MNLRERFVSLLPQQAIRVFAQPYVAGDSIDAALAKARVLAGHGVAATLDVLGEDAGSAADIAHYVSVYTRLARAIIEDNRLGKLSDNIRPSISLKPSMFVIAPKDDQGMIRNPEVVPWQECEDTIRELVGTITKSDLRVTIDMENHQWTDFTLTMYRRLFERYGRMIGTVLQARLNRTMRDIEQLPEGCRIRLCIGIYDEPAAFATRENAEMKSRMIPMARRLLEKNVFLEFATHDLPLIQRFVREVIVAGQIGPDRFETQTLLGVPRQPLIAQLTTGEYFAPFNGASPTLRNGIMHRLYVPFAEDWDQAIAYSRRRLQHSPNLFWTGLLNAPRVLWESVMGR